MERGGGGGGVGGGVQRRDAMAADGPREEDGGVQGAEGGGGDADGVDGGCEGGHERTGQNRVSYREGAHDEGGGPVVCLLQSAVAHDLMVTFLIHT